MRAAAIRPCCSTSERNPARQKRMQWYPGDINNHVLWSKSGPCSSNSGTANVAHFLNLACARRRQSFGDFFFGFSSHVFVSEIINRRSPVGELVWRSSTFAVANWAKMIHMKWVLCTVFGYSFGRADYPIDRSIDRRSDRLQVKRCNDFETASLPRPQHLEARQLKKIASSPRCI